MFVGQTGGINLFGRFNPLIIGSVFVGFKKGEISVLTVFVCCKKKSNSNFHSKTRLIAWEFTSFKKRYKYRQTDWMEKFNFGFTARV